MHVARNVIQNLNPDLSASEDPSLSRKPSCPNDARPWAYGEWGDGGLGGEGRERRWRVKQSLSVEAKRDVRTAERAGSDGNEAGETLLWTLRDGVDGQVWGDHQETAGVTRGQDDVARLGRSS